MGSSRASAVKALPRTAGTGSDTKSSRRSMPGASMTAASAVIASCLSGPVIARSVTILMRTGTAAWSPSADNARRA